MIETFCHFLKMQGMLMLQSFVTYNIRNNRFKMLYWLLRFLSAIETMLDKDIIDNRAIGDAGAKAILSHCPKDSMVRILTHCNTGSLATAGYGTALGVIRSLHSLKRLGKYQ